MIRKLFIVMLCFMLVPIVCSQALGASAYYVISNDNGIKYAQDKDDTAYNPDNWSNATTTANSLKDFFASDSLAADDIVYMKSGTFTITATIEIKKNVTVYGGFKDGDSDKDSQTGTTTIKGGTGFSGSVFKISSGIVTLYGLTITGGKVSGGDSSNYVGGGGVNNNGGTLTMANCTVTSNEVTGTYGTGGGVYNEGGSLTMTNCAISGNTATHGGGIYNHQPLTMTNCTIIGNTATGESGGGVWSNNSLTMTNCTITGNEVTGYTQGNEQNGGGGLFNNTGTLTLINCTITGNKTVGNYASEVNTSGNLAMTNTFVWGAIVKVQGSINANYCAAQNTANLTGNENIAISWSTQTSKDVTVKGVTHTVYRIEDNYSELSSLEGAGTKNDNSLKDALKDQLGHTRYDPPCIGAVEIVHVPEIPETLKIDAIEGKAITAQTIKPTKGLDIIWSMSGNLPEGLTTESTDTTITISGTPASGTAANSPYNYKVTATNSAGSKSTVVTVNVSDLSAPVLSYDKEITLTEGEAMTDFTITATNKDIVTWSSTGTLPDGLTYSSKDNTFTISGTPSEGTSANSPYKYTVTAENAADKTEAQVTITINAADNTDTDEGSTDENEDTDTDEGSETPETKSFKPVLSESTINYTEQEGYTIENIVINATSGDNLTWSASGTLPDGLTGAESSGTSYTISGTLAMNTEGSYTYTITAKNDAGEASSVVNITVEKFSLNLDTLTEPEENQTLSEYLSGTLGLSTEQLATLTEFKIPAKITDLNGIAELMPHLQTLDLTEAVSLGENLDLRVLGNLQLEQVNLSGNTAIKTLNLKGCNIKNVNAEGCKGLVSVDVAGNEFIEELQLSSTDISEINASGCKNLKTLHVANAKVSKIDLTGCDELLELDIHNNSVRKFHKDLFRLAKLSKLNARHQLIYKSLLNRIFDLVAFMLGNDDESDTSTAGLVINSAVSSGDENLIKITGYDESGSKIEYDDSEYAETGQIRFYKSPAKIVYDYDTGLTSMDVTVVRTLYEDEDDDEDNYLADSGGGCDSGFTFGALLALGGLAFIHRRKH